MKLARRKARFLVRETRPADLRGALAVARALPDWFTPGALEQMKRDLRFQRGLVAVEAPPARGGRGSGAGGRERVVGFLSYFVTTGVAQLAWMGVRPERHRRGAGRLLAVRLFSVLQRGGVEEVLVNTLGDSVDYEPYARTRAFYRALGFEEHRRIPDYSDECPELLVLRKSLP